MILCNNDDFSFSLVKSYGFKDRILDVTNTFKYLLKEKTTWIALWMSRILGIIEDAVTKIGLGSPKRY